MWRRWMFENFKTHAVCAELEGPLLDDLRRRGAREMSLPADSSIVNPAAIADWCLDIGGPCHTERPYESFPWHGLTMGVPSEHVGRIADVAAGLRQRRFDAGPSYYKLKLWHHALVMTPVQYHDLVAALTALVEPAEVRAEAFESAVRRASLHGVS